MLLAPHRPYDLGEESEVTVLDSERMTLEEREYHFVQLPEVLNGVRHNPAVRPLRSDCSTTEEAGQLFEHQSMVFVLVHLERCGKLPTTRTPHERVAVNAYGEATFSVDEPYNP